MIKNTIVRVIMGLCGLLLVAAATPLNARDAALPPGADFQAGIQGASAHHREKRSLLTWTKAVLKTMHDRGYTLILGRFYTKHARERLCLDQTRCLDPRMTARVVEHIIRNGTSYWDNKYKRVVRVVHGDGGVVLATPLKDRNTPDGVVITILTWSDVRKKLDNGQFVNHYHRKNLGHETSSR